MKTATKAATTVCWAFASTFDSELLAPLVLLLAVLAVGGVAVWFAFRWYRKWKQPLSTAEDDFDQLARSLQQQDGLDPHEIARIRAAIDRKKEQGGPGSKQVML
jgi:hypothetical protein